MLINLQPITCSRLLSRAKHFLAGVPLKKRGIDGNVDVAQFKNKPVLLYFSAGWCGQCKTLTPKITKFYDGLGNRKEEMEVVWISNDKEQDHQQSTYEKMPPFNFIPFGDPNIKMMGEKYKAAVIPVVKIVNEKGEVISDRARAEIEEYVKKDPATALDMWKKKM